MGIVRILFSLYGRIGRTTYVALIVLNIVASAALHEAFGGGPSSTEEPTLVALVLSLMLSYVGIASAVKRFHDRDKSGWWLLLPLGLFFIAAATAFGQGLATRPQPSLESSGIALALAGMGIAVSFWQAIELLFFGPIGPGDGSVNRFGTRIALFEDADPAPARQDADPFPGAGGPPAPEPPRPARRVAPPPLAGVQRGFGRRGLT